MKTSHVFCRGAETLYRNGDDLTVRPIDAPSARVLAGAALTHAATMLAGAVPQVLNSRLQYLTGGEGEKTTVFAAPIEPVIVRSVGHPQPLTLPRRLPGLKLLTVKGVILPA